MYPQSRWFPEIALIVLVLAGASLAWAQDRAPANLERAANPQDQVVISVDDQKMTATDVQKFIESLPPQFRAYYGGPGRHLLPQYLVQLKVLAGEARRQKLDDQPDVRQAIEIASNSILADAEKRRLEQTIPISDAQVKEEYEKLKPNLEEVRIRRLLIRTSTAVLAPAATPTHPPLPEAEARKKLEDLRKQILAGADFPQVARSNSEDLATAGSGGDMGYATRQTLLPPLASAAYAMSPGQVSEIISTPYGLELIQLEDKRFKPLEEVRPQLESQLRQGRLDEMLKGLIAQHQVSVDKDFFAPPKKTGGSAPTSASPSSGH